MSEVKQEVKKAVAIIRGRISLPIVFLIRHVEDASKTTKELAEKYATTVGKIDDIRKCRNFAYVTEDVRFTEAQIEEAVTYIAQHEDSDAASLVTDMLRKLEIATPEQAEAFAGTKKKAGGQPRTDADGNVLDAGGGNRQNAGTVKKGKNAAKAEAVEGEGVVEETLAEAEAREAAEDAAQAAEGQGHQAEDLLDI